VFCVIINQKDLKDMVCIIIAPTAVTTLVGIFTMVGMLILLIAQELADAGGGLGLKLLSRHLTVAVIPLFIILALIVLMSTITAIAGGLSA
jgi:hypothetical protein